MSFLSRLFGATPVAREEKRSRAGAMLALHTLGQARWTPRDYVALTREGYERNAVVHRSVRMIAENVATIPWRLYEGRHEVTEHPLLDLLSRPNPTDTSTDFLEGIVTNLLLFGNAYIEAASIDGVPRELYNLRADRMSVVPGPNGWPAAYDYIAIGDRVRYEMQGFGVEPICQIKLAHPLDDHYGLPPLAAAQVALDTHNAAGFWNKALLDNAARPSGALVYGGHDGGQFSDAQFDRLKAELEENFSGPGNAGRPLLLDGGLDWKALSLTPKDMDFIEAKAAAAREIALCFGVPSLLLGLPGDNTRANYSEANRAFWRGTIIPMTTRLQKSFQHWLAPAFPGLRLDYDVDRIDALADERVKEWTRIGAADFLTEDEKREALGYGPMPQAVKGVRPPEAQYQAQPRDDVGRWMSGGGGGGQSADAPLADMILDIASDIIAGDLSALLPVDLLAEEAGGGHTIEQHVGKSDEYLMRRIIDSRSNFLGFRSQLDWAGTFPSVEAANKLVNSTLSSDLATLEKVANGEIFATKIDKFFSSPTGEEFYGKNLATPYKRTTYGTRVIIRHDQSRQNGYRIISAFPIFSGD